MVRSVKLIVFGADYGDRLYDTIGMNLLLAVIAGLHLAIKQRWIAVVAAVILALGWPYMAAVNSAV